MTIRDILDNIHIYWEEAKSLLLFEKSWLDANIFSVLITIFLISLFVAAFLSYAYILYQFLKTFYSYLIKAFKYIFNADFRKYETIKWKEKNPHIAQKAWWFLVMSFFIIMYTLFTFMLLLGGYFSIIIVIT